MTTMQSETTTLIQRIERGLTTVEDAETVRRLADHFKKHVLINISVGWTATTDLVDESLAIIKEIEDGG